MLRKTTTGVHSLREISSRVGLALSSILCVTATFAVTRLPAEGNPVPAGVSKDPNYGFSQTDPIRVGRRESGTRAARVYLNSLRGPRGEEVLYRRLGNCCHFKTPNAWVEGRALLDRYEVTYAGLETPRVLYLDLYDYEQPLVPVGFTKEGRK